MKNKFIHLCERYNRYLLAAIFVAGLLIRLLWIGVDFNITADLPLLRDWVVRLHEEGLLPFYVETEIRPYPPLSIYLLSAAGWLANVLSNSSSPNDSLLNTLIKFPAILADIGTAALLLWQARRQTALWRIAVVALYLLNPAVWYVSVYWGQLDAVYLFFLVAALMLLSRGAVTPAWLVYALSLSAKLQGLPPIFLFILWTWVHHGRQALAKGITTTCGTILILVSPWLLSGRISEMIEAITTSTLRVVQTAYNFWYLILGERVSIEEPSSRMALLSITYQTAGFIMFFAVVAFVSILIIRHKHQLSLPLTALVIYFAAFLFLTDIRERYLFPVLPLLLWAANQQRRLIWLYLLLSATWFFNLITIASFAPQWWTNLVAWKRPFPVHISILTTISKLVSAIHLVLFGWLCWQTKREQTPQQLST